MKFFSNLRLQQKIFFFLSILITGIFILLFIGVWWNMRSQLTNQQKEKMQEHLADLVNLCELHKEDRQKSLDNAARLAQNLFLQMGQYKEDSTQMIQMNIKHQETQAVTRLSIPTMYIGKQKINFNYDWVDNIEKMTGFQCIIFQKIPQGFLRVATTHLVSDKSIRVIGTYLPKESVISKTISEGKDYSGTASNNNNSTVLTHYMPIKHKGKVVGILAVGGQTKDDKSLGTRITARKYFNSGYVYVMAGNGEVIYHPNPKFKGTNFKYSNQKFYSSVIKNKSGSDRYFINNEWRWQHYQYYKPFDIYIGIVVSEKKFLNDILNELFGMLLFMILTLLFLSLYIINILLKPLLKPLKTIESSIGKLANGLSVKKLNFATKDEIGDICNSLNNLIEEVRKYTYFAEEIGKNNLEANLKLSHKDNVLGNALLKMQSNLLKVEQENTVKSWAIEHNVILSETLRKYSDSIDLLSEKVLNFFIYYLPMQQGAFYTVEENEKNEKYLAMKIAYAYERKKMIKQHIDTRDGLLGQVYRSGEMIYSEEMPKNYLTFTTGLENYQASYLLIVPLKIGNEVFGLLELVSFYPLEKYKIDFMLQCSETIASSMSITQSNELTKILLVDMQETAERLMQQDEELRQNLEELETLQEVSDEKQKEIERLLENAKFAHEQSKENTKQLKMMQIDNLKKQQEYLKIIEEHKKEIELLKMKE
ncbi:MAG: HAMP domain-containing protein [Cytophagales bacterium]|nr:MAG: HAMP domain-containing protein [Cytophagales bacterium]